MRNVVTTSRKSLTSLQDFRGKKNNMSVGMVKQTVLLGQLVPSKDSDQTGHLLSLISVFAVHNHNKVPPRQFEYILL